MIRIRSSSTLVSSQLGKHKTHAFYPLIIGIVMTLAILVVIGVTFASIKLISSYAATPLRGYTHITSINGLKKISVVGATDKITDHNGKTITVDPNPYGVIIAPMNEPNGIKKGDLLVTNIGNNDTGTTLVKFANQKGPGHLFNVSAKDGTVGPADLTVNKQTGTIWVSNKNGNKVEIFRPNGALLTTITSRLFAQPWGMATNDGAVRASGGVINSFFINNALTATIDRIDVIPQKVGLPHYRIVQIGQFKKNGDETKSGLLWLPELKVGKRTMKDVLLAIDPANNRIAAFANSSTINTRGAPGKGQGVTVFAGKPLNMPGGFAIDPLNHDLLVVNLMDNNLVELNMAKSSVVGVKQIDPAKVDNQGNGSALFGVAATKDDKGNLLVFFTDDNTNTVDALKVS